MTSTRKSLLTLAVGNIGRWWAASGFRKNCSPQLAAAQRSAAQRRLVALLGPTCESYLSRLAQTDRSLTRQVRELLAPVREYGPEAVAAALNHAHAAGTFGADYVANLLRQQQTPREIQPPLRFRDPLLNELATDPLSLLDYDRFILRSKKDSDDLTTTELEQLNLTTIATIWSRCWLRLRPEISARCKAWKRWSIASSRADTSVPSNGASNSPVCRRNLPSTASTFTTTSLATS
jgi:hypothetical protein